MEEPQLLQDPNFPLFKTTRKTPSLVATTVATIDTTTAVNPSTAADRHEYLDETATDGETFGDLGLAEWAVKTCWELGMQKPRRVQQVCIPRVLEGRHVLGIDETGSGKTAAFALPVLHRLAEHPFGVFALVVTPTRELAFQLAEQFRALGSAVQLRITVVVGGMDMLKQAKDLVARPHIVIATPGRIHVLLRDNPDISPVFSKTKFLVLDEADRVLDVCFQEELKFIFQCLPENRQNLFFSATTTSNLQKLRERYKEKMYVYEAYEGYKTVESLKQQVIFIPKKVKDVYLMHILSKMEDMGIRSAIVFISTCRDCHRLSLMLEVLDQEAAALYSFKSQTQRLEALHQFKSGKVSVLLATDIASRGLDIPTVDLVINYDVPRFPRDYIHRVGRTARAGREGLALTVVTQNINKSILLGGIIIETENVPFSLLADSYQDACHNYVQLGLHIVKVLDKNDVELIHEIEALIEKQLEMIEYKESEALSLMKKVFSAKNVAEMKMIDDGFEEKAKERKKQKLKMLAEKGLLKKNKKRKLSKEFSEKGKEQKKEVARERGLLKKKKLKERSKEFAEEVEVSTPKKRSKKRR